MAHGARTRVVLAAALLSLAGCGDGNDTADGSQPASTPADPSPPASRQAVVFQTFAGGGDTDVLAVNEDGSRRASLAATDEREQFRGVSRDGWVVYERDTDEQGMQLMSVRVTGGDARVLDASNAGKQFRGFTPDDRVVYQRATDTGTAILSVRPDGTSPVVLVDEPYVLAEFAGASALGRVLYQTCERPRDPQAPPQCVSEGLHSVAADGSGRRLLAAGRPHVRHVSGERVIYETNAGGQFDLHAIEADGSQAVALADSPDDESLQGLLPDGRVLYGRRVAGQWDVYIVNPDGTESRALLSDPADEFVAGVTPSGRILFLRGPGGSRSLYAIDADGTDLAVLGASNDDENLRRITNEGRVIYSTRRAAGGVAQDDLYSVAPDGTDLRILADSTDFEWFEDVAPDGRVVYMRCVAAPGGPCGDPGAQSDLYSVRQDGAGTAALAATGDFEIYRGVTDHSRVIYERRVGDQHDIESVTSEGTDRRVLADGPLDERFQAIY